MNMQIPSYFLLVVVVVFVVVVAAVAVVIPHVGVLTTGQTN